MKWPRIPGQKESSSSMSLHLTEEGMVGASAEQETELRNAKLVTSFEEWKQMADTWPMKRLVSVWNELPDVVPVRKFTSRPIAVERIWRVIQGAEKRPRRKPVAVSFRAGSKAAQVLALLSRPEGATTREIQEMTGWQRHSVRGFLSAGIRKQGQKIRAFQRSGERVYRLTG
jgi:SAM-dependent MidA family methyltransferase